ncbi:MAG: hypothetical protein R3E10_16420 [Gemmatimonadota bacterium]
MRYLDGELSPEEAVRIEGELASSTELQRDIALFQAMKADLQQLSFDPQLLDGSVWERVHRRLTRPIGWMLILLGAVVWISYGTWMYSRSSIALWEKMATGGVVLGIVLLFATVLYERYRHWQVDPYKDVYR